ncbi:MAG: phospholipase D family protein [Gudongella sp.]|nr:phospholipase D family protein [Gudongella sp.]
MDENMNLFGIIPESKQKIDVVKMDFIEAETTTWQELFSGYNKLYAITYSSGMEFVYQLLKHFDYSEIIFGFDGVMSYKLQEIMAYQQRTIERIIESSNKTKTDLIAMIDNKALRMYISRSELSHEKMYLLEADDGRKRVITGSANMSYSAFSGIQRENIIYVDNSKAFDWYFDSFISLKESSTDDITIKSLLISDYANNIDELPISQTVKSKKVLAIQPDLSVKDEIRYALDISKLKSKLSPLMPKSDKNGKILLSPEKILHTRRKIIESNIQEKELRSEYPQLVIDVENMDIMLNDSPIDLNPTYEEIQNDVNLFIEYMEGYNRFHGDVKGLQYKYYSFAIWFFTTPFMANMRNIAVKYNQNLLPYPVFGILYGQSKAGKTKFLETLLKMMIGQKPKISAPDFTKTTIDGLKRTVKGAPIIVDDLTQTRFNQHAIELIKNEEFGVEQNLNFYPAVVISANEDIKAVAPEIVRRTVICHVQAGIKNTEMMRISTVRKVQNNIGTALYREYLRRMLEIVPDLINNIKDENLEGIVDILEVSSEVIFNIINEYKTNDMPNYIRKLSLDDYFGDRVTGAQAINKITNAWEVNRKGFEVNRKRSQLIYNAAQTWEADRILKELPEDLEAIKSREFIIMDLVKATEFFDIDFKKESGILGIIKNRIR